MGRSSQKHNCNPQVKVLFNIFNRVLVSCDKKTHNKCVTTKNASLIPGCEIDIFLSSILTAYNTESKEGITIKATAVEEDKEY